MGPFKIRMYVDILFVKPAAESMGCEWPDSGVLESS